MTYQFEFFLRTRDKPSGETVRRHAADFADLQGARAFGISGLGNVNPVTDGCRIYLDGVYKATVSVHSEPGIADRS